MMEFEICLNGQGTVFISDFLKVFLAKKIIAIAPLPKKMEGAMAIICSIFFDVPP